MPVVGGSRRYDVRVSGTEGGMEARRRLVVAAGRGSA